MLDEGGCKTGWMWTLVGPGFIFYLFALSRAAKVAETLIGGNSGFLQVDAYAGYNTVCQEGGRIRVGCWAHARRLFFDAFSVTVQPVPLLQSPVGLHTCARRRSPTKEGMMGTRRSESQWAELKNQFAASGLSQRAFCRQRGLSLSAFRSSIQRATKAMTPVPQNGFVEVLSKGGPKPRSAEPPSKGRVRVTMTVFDFEKMPDLEYLAALHRLGTLR